MLREATLDIFTDGSSLGPPRAGGIGIRFVHIDSSSQEQTQDIPLPGYRGATNNQMELKACITGLEEAARLGLAAGVSKIVIRTDSLYIVNNYRKAMFEWPRTRWLTRSGAPVLNADLWKELVKEMKNAGVRVEIEWVRGHSKSPHNRAADKMARKSAGLPLNDPLSLVHVRRKISSKSVDRGCIALQGQRMSIRIITAEYLKVQRVWKCKYEVISKASKHYGNIDMTFSDTLLCAGHSYYVVMNDDTQNPRVKKVIREIKTKPRQPEPSETAPPIQPIDESGAASANSSG
jgi:ribonuclease HI